MDCSDEPRISEECQRVSKLMSEANKRGCPSEARRLYYEWRHKQTWTIPQDENNEIDWQEWFNRDKYGQ